MDSSSLSSPLPAVAKVVRGKLSGEIMIGTVKTVWSGGNCVSPPSCLRLLADLCIAADPEALAGILPTPRPADTVRFSAKTQQAFEPLPLDTEEKGLLTVARNSKKVSDIFESSFLKPEKIAALLAAYTLCGLIEFESAEVTRRREHEKSLGADGRAIRDEIGRRTAALDRTHYYAWLDAEPGMDAAAIQKKADALIERFAAPSIEKLFLEDERPALHTLLRKFAEARAVLMNDTKRREYDRYLSSGKTGSFVQESAAVRDETVLAQGERLAAAGKFTEAAALFERALAEKPTAALAAAYSRTVLRAGGQGAARDKALAELKKGIEKFPGDASLFEVLAEWGVTLNQKPRAAEAYARAVALDPARVSARDGLMKLDPDQGRRTIVRALYRGLSGLTYYGLLGTERKSPLERIHAAYRACSKQFHPDRFFQADDPEIQEQAKEVYKRMVDAYMTLKNPEKRAAYDASLSNRGGSCYDAAESG